MGYIITSIIAVVLLISLVYELPNYVYNRKYAVIGFMRWYTPVYIAVFFTVLAVLVGDGIIMIKLTATLSFKSVRIWIGIVAGLIGLLYFFRLIPIYYDEKFDVKSKEKAVGVFVRELVAIVLFEAALLMVSFYIWSFVIDGAVFLLLFLWRLRRFLIHRKIK